MGNNTSNNVGYTTTTLSYRLVCQLSNEGSVELHITNTTKLKEVRQINSKSTTNIYHMYYKNRP